MTALLQIYTTNHPSIKNILYNLIIILSGLLFHNIQLKNVYGVILISTATKNY